MAGGGDARLSCVSRPIVCGEVCHLSACAWRVGCGRRSATRFTLVPRAMICIPWLLSMVDHFEMLYTLITLCAVTLIAVCRKRVDRAWCSVLLVLLVA